MRIWQAAIAGMLTLAVAACGSGASGGQPGAAGNGRLEVGVVFPSLSAVNAAVWEGKAGHRIHRVQQMYNLEAPDWLWTSGVPAMMNAGYKLMLTFEPKLNADVYATSPSRLNDIANGVYDTTINRHIRLLKSSVLASFPDADIWIRFGHEMNGDWYPWGVQDAYGNPRNGNTPAIYIAAFRHVANLYRAAGIGANAVKWVWSPNVWPTDNFTALYPGDPYADIVAMSGFNFGPNTRLHPTLRWQPFDTIFRFTYDTLAAAMPAKPLIIAATSCAESGGDKAAWIDDMARKLRAGYPRLSAVFWFDEDKRAAGEADWRIDSSPAALAAIRRMYADTGLWLP